MTNHVLAVLETALRARKLDYTLTRALPSLAAGAPAPAATGLAVLDERLGGGLPRGQLSEVTGPRSSGRQTLLMHLAAAATRRGEIAAVVDTFDRLDVASAIAAGVDLDRLLWIRGQDLQSPIASTVERALKAFNLVLQAGGFGVVALDLGDAPLAALNSIPFTTWLRVQRTIEGRDTACVLVTPHPLARSAGGLTLSLTGRGRWHARGGSGDRLGTVHRLCRCLTGVDVTVRIISPRRRSDGEVTIRATTVGARS